MACGDRAMVVHAQGADVCQDVYDAQIDAIHEHFIRQARQCRGDRECIAQAVEEKAAQIEEATQTLLQCDVCTVNWGDWHEAWDRTLGDIYEEIRPKLARLYATNNWQFTWKFKVKVSPQGQVEAQLDQSGSSWFPQQSAGAKKAFEQQAAYLKKELESIHPQYPRGSNKQFVRRTPKFSTQGVRETSAPIEEEQEECMP